MKKGQSATEFVVLATLMFLLFSIAFIYIESLLVDFTKSGQQSEMKAIRVSIEKELLLADRMPTGYERRFHLPESINGVYYNITVQPEAPPRKDALLVTFKEEKTVFYVDQDISGKIYPGDNVLRKNPTLVFN